MAGNPSLMENLPINKAALVKEWQINIMPDRDNQASLIDYFNTRVETREPEGRDMSYGRGETGDKRQETKGTKNNDQILKRFIFSIVADQRVSVCNE